MSSAPVTLMRNGSSDRKHTIPLSSSAKCPTWSRHRRDKNASSLGSANTRFVNIPDVWKGDRNPVRYSSEDELGIDFDKLDWKPMPDATAQAEGPSVPPARSGNGEVQPLTIIEAKKMLAITFGVAPEALDITIHG